MSLVFTRATLC